MPKVFFVLLLIQMNQSLAQEINREQLIQLIDGAQKANCQDVSFDYEGKEVRSTQLKSPGIRKTYTGSFKHRADGATLCDLYRFDQNDKQPTHAVVAILDQITTSSTLRDDQKKASISVRKQDSLEYAGASNYRQIWLVDLVKKLAMSSYVYEYLGLRMIDNHETIAIRFWFTYPEENQPHSALPSETFWIDFNRGGHVVRHEFHFPGENLAKATIIQLKRFEPKDGRNVWLPVSGVVNAYLTLSEKQERVFKSEPVSFCTYDLLASTIKFDQRLKDDQFSVKARPGDVVSDEVRKARYEFGQYMVRAKTVTRPPTDGELKAEMERMLNDSKVMANELNATSPAREGSFWWTLGPWGVAGGALTGIVLIYHRQRRSAM